MVKENHLCTWQHRTPNTVQTWLDWTRTWPTVSGCLHSRSTWKGERPPCSPLSISLSGRHGRPHSWSTWKRDTQWWGGEIKSSRHGHANNHQYKNIYTVAERPVDLVNSDPVIPSWFNNNPFHWQHPWNYSNLVLLLWMCVSHLQKTLWSNSSHNLFYWVAAPAATLMLSRKVWWQMCISVQWLVDDCFNGPTWFFTGSGLLSHPYWWTVIYTQLHNHMCLAIQQFTFSIVLNQGGTWSMTD